jgi:hypothetical protein
MGAVLRAGKGQHSSVAYCNAQSPFSAKCGHASHTLPPVRIIPSTRGVQWLLAAKACNGVSGPPAHLQLADREVLAGFGAGLAGK